MYYSTTYSSPIGRMTLMCKDDHLAGLWLEGQKYFGSTMPRVVETKDDTPIFRIVFQWLDKYFRGEQPKIAELPLAPEGSEFRKAVWTILCDIPYGEVMTYGEIAKKIAIQMGKKSMSSQAVGGAVGHNPILVIIPCHRVVGSNGSLTGYAGGITTKKELLKIEGVDLSTLCDRQSS